MYIHIYMNIYIYIYIYIHIYLCIHICICIWTQAEGVVAMVDVVLNHRTATAVRSPTSGYIYMATYMAIYMAVCIYR